MSTQEKSKGPNLAVKAVAAAIIGLALLCTSAGLIVLFISKSSGQPGFLGTRGTLFADLNLVAEIILLFGLTAGFAFAKLGNIPLHQYNQTAWTLFNIVLTLFIMAVSFAQNVVPVLPADLVRLHGLVSTIHALLGLLTISCAIYIILRMNRLLPKMLRISWWKWLMRITLGLYWLVGLFGIGTYVVWYVVPRPEVAVTPQATAEAGKVLVPLANYEFVPNDLTVPVGTTVQFQNADPDPHTVTFDNNEFPATGLLPGDKGKILFDKVGVFQIYCEYHGSPGLKGMSLVVRVVPAGELAAVPTSANVPTATPRPSPPPLSPQESSPNGFALFQDTQARNDTFNLTVSNLTPATAGEYQVWLTGTAVTLNLGKLAPDASNSANLIYFAPAGENLLATYTGFLITLETAGSTPDTPSASVAFGGVIAQAAVGPAQQLLARGDASPGNVGYAIGLTDQAEEMLRHAVEINRAAQGGDVVSANRHIEHLTAILVGKKSPEYLDFTGDGFIDDPGDGFGILSYAGAITAQAQIVAAAPDMPDSVKQHATQLSQVAANFTDWGNQLLTLRLAAHNAQTDADRSNNTVQIAQLATQVLNGVDANGNGTVEPISGEGGAYAAYFESQYLASMGVLTESVLNAQPTAAPPTATVEAGQPTPTTGPTNTPAPAPTAGPVIVVFRNFVIVPDTLTIKAGTQIIFTIEGSQHEPYLSFANNTDIAGFDSGPLSPGAQFPMTFSNPGTFTIRCGFHPNKMVMTLTVEP